ncbi:hypothetical protein HAX54_005704, partial [Datura stramonium]|nr:hypothetical protein [Datura stramonium]
VGTGYSLVLHRWHRLFTDASQVGICYSSVLHRLALATHRLFTGWHQLFTGGLQVGTV